MNEFHCDGRNFKNNNFRVQFANNSLKLFSLEIFSIIEDLKVKPKLTSESFNRYVKPGLLGQKHI